MLKLMHKITIFLLVTTTTLPMQKGFLLEKGKKPRKQESKDTYVHWYHDPASKTQKKFGLNDPYRLRIIKREMHYYMF